MGCDETTSFLPFAVPELRSRNMRIGEKGLLRRLFPEGKDECFRLYENEPLSLGVEFHQEEPQALVHLYTNLDDPPDVWRDLAFARDESGVHRLTYRVGKRGVYQFKIKYSLDGGDTWYWDRLPFSRVVVDSAALKDIRMYTLIPTVSGTLEDWIALLPGIAGLGCNAIHLLPLTELDLSESPYAARDFFSIDVSYRGADSRNGFAAFQRFVEAARDHGIRLCFDLILNHVGVGSRMVRECPEWIMPDRKEKDGLKRAGCWHMNTWLTWEDLVRIDYDHPHSDIRADIWAYMTDYALFWAHFACLTGGMVRFDNLHASHEGFIGHLVEVLRRTYPDLVIMAEFFTDSNTVLKKTAEWNIDLVLANSWEYPYAGDLRKYIRYIHDIGCRIRHYVPITTHDTGAPAQLFGAARAAVPRYAVTSLMGPGRTGIVQGTEYGCPEKITFIGRQEKRRFTDHPSIADGIRRINKIFAASDLFHREGNIDFIDNDHGAVLGALRRSDRADREGFLVFANLDVENGYTLAVDLSSLLGPAGDLRLEDCETGMAQVFPLTAIQVSIGPCGVRIFRCRVAV